MAEEMPAGITDGEVMMINTLYINPGRWDEYQAALQEILPQARALEACLVLEAGQVADEPGTVILTERWRSGVEYVTEVLKLPMFEKYLAATEAMYAKPRTVVVLNSL
ncbi:putative quinol monooxygenase [Streptomyces asiaticus]|uniref:putative quinol monooxygenase n=1 Tax=Streptomyces asiaticus TaxID=114695 RepID=UPI003F66A220